jgi:hypothetical protein
VEWICHISPFRRGRKCYNGISPDENSYTIVRWNVGVQTSVTSDGRHDAEAMALFVSRAGGIYLMTCKRDYRLQSHKLTVSTTKHIVHNIRSRNVISTIAAFIYTTGAACNIADIIFLGKHTTCCVF